MGAVHDVRSSSDRMKIELSGVTVALPVGTCRAAVHSHHLQTPRARASVQRLALLVEFADPKLKIVGVVDDAFDAKAGPFGNEFEAIHGVQEQMPGRVEAAPVNVIVPPCPADHRDANHHCSAGKKPIPSGGQGSDLIGHMLQRVTEENHVVAVEDLTDSRPSDANAKLIFSIGLDECINPFSPVPKFTQVVDQMPPATTNVKEALILAKPTATHCVEIGSGVPVDERGKRREIKPIPHFAESISARPCHAVVFMRVVREEVVGNVKQKEAPASTAFLIAEFVSGAEHHLSNTMQSSGPTSADFACHGV